MVGKSTKMVKNGWEYSQTDKKGQKCSKTMKN